MNTIIKSTYLFIVAALLFSACSQDDMPGRAEGESGRIFFRTSLPGLTSRAEIITEENLPYFHVTAFDPADGSKVVGGILQTNFANEKVEITEGEDTYTSSGCTWPDPGMESHTVTFFAFYPGLKKLGEVHEVPEDQDVRLTNNSTTTDFKYSIEGLTIKPEIADQVDFVTAYTTGSMAENMFTGITLPFVHQLSRIEIKAWSANKSCDIEIAGVRIGGINMKGTFNFMADNRVGYWSDLSDKGVVEYVFRKDDKIVSLVKGAESTSTDTCAVSIMGSKVKINGNDNDNCAMLIPTAYAGWNFATDRNNSNKNMYISVLLRVTDATLTAGTNPPESQRYPYKDLSQGANALNIPVVYLAVDKATGTVAKRLYKRGNSYFTDADVDAEYTLSDTEEIKEFGWAALPVTVNWEPGNIYTYILDYTSGVGLHDPEVAVSATAPNAGDPIISDKVGITCTVKKWNDGGGDEFIVPGS